FGVVGGWPLNLDAARRALRSRGPDDSGIYSSAICQLIHTRLAIQDLSPLGHQPMLSDAAGLALVFNGEIYNAPQLRRELLDLGDSFRSHSDTEVILRGYGRWGDALWPRLEGIYACGIWHEGQQKLTLARDPFGIKPLYILSSAQSLVFSSELSALRASGAASEPDAAAVAAYGLWGAYAGPATALVGVQSLSPGVIAHWTPASGFQVKQRQAMPPVASPQAIDEAVAGVAQRLRAAVAAQAIGDVPVGCFLSGGIDSGILAALLQDCSTEKVTTLSVGFRDVPGAEDESARAQATADLLGTNHQSIRFGVDDFDGLFDEFLEAIDAPSIDGFNTFLVSRAAHQVGLKVAFSGLGADEVFAGYPQFSQWQRAIEGSDPGRRLGDLPIQLLRLIRQEGQAYASRGLGAALDLRQIPFHGLTAEQRDTLIAVRLSSVEDSRDLAALSQLELTGYLRDTLLRDTDAVSMHHGLEVRVPYLDQELVRYCLSLPGAWHLADGPKTLLRRAFAQRLPELVTGSAKTGFNLPLGPWLLASPRFAPQRIAALLKPWGVSRRSVLASWAYLRWQPARWQPYWRWVVLAEWLQGTSC
ncbi:MAG: asparagine synthase (glutamine-hydrolyzing), partial [Prochlorococcaceae cyanobacterium]